MSGTVAAAVQLIKSAVTTGTLNVVVNGVSLIVNTSSFTSSHVLLPVTKIPTSRTVVTNIVTNIEHPIPPPKVPIVPSGISDGAIAGTVVAIVLVAAIVIFAIVVYMKKSDNKVD